jgi:hypothetical protein
VSLKNVLLVGVLVLHFSLYSQISPSPLLRVFHFIWVHLAVGYSCTAHTGFNTDGGSWVCLLHQDWRGRLGSFSGLIIPVASFHLHTGKTVLDWFLMKDLSPPFRLHSSILRK